MDDAFENFDIKHFDLSFCMFFVVNIKINYSCCRENNNQNIDFYRYGNKN